MSIKFNLKDIIEKIDWKVLQSGKSGTTMPDDGVGVSFSKNDKKTPGNDADHIKVRFGQSVLERLNWKTGDKITVLQDPDDLLSILLVKKDSKGGRALCKESTSSVNYMCFKWNSLIRLKKSKSKIVDYDIYKQYIHFRLPNEND